MRTFVRQVDTKVTGWITGLPGALRPFFLFITNLGHPVVPITIGLVIVIVGVLRSDIPLMLSGTSIWVVLGIGSFLKQLFRRARPLTDYAAKIWLDKLSFPSGHTTGSTIAYGMLGYYALTLLALPWSIIVFALCSLLIVGVGTSRVYLGAHFPSDVVAGWILGAVGLLAAVLLIQPA